MTINTTKPSAMVKVMMFGSAINRYHVMFI